MPRLEWWFLVQQRCGSKSSYNGSAIRFVSCDDDCLDPFGTVECGESFEESPVSGDGDDVCFGSRNQETNRIDFGSKMPTNAELFFVPSDEDSNVVQSAYIHTSCSKPVYPNWATVFAEDCSSSDSSVVNLDNVTSPGSLGLHVAFIDGVSPGYYQVAKELYNETGISYFDVNFDVNFADCGCNWGATGAPTISPSPTLAPSPHARGPIASNGPPMTSPVLVFRVERQVFFAASYIRQQNLRKDP